MFKIELNLPSKVHLRNVGGEAVNWEVEKTPADVLARVLEAGAKVVLTNAFNSGGKDVPESERLANMQKRMDAWYNGSYEVTSRGGKTSFGQAWEAYVHTVQAAYPNETESSVMAKRKATIEAVLGKDAKNTMENFIESTVIAKGTKKADIANESEAMLGRLLERYAKLEAERAKATDGLDLTTIDI